jgi:3-hydroxyisobutyrate dehydrogenase
MHFTLNPHTLVYSTGLRAVISMLPSPQHVKEAYLGTDGLFATAPQTFQPSLLIDSSTTDPGTAREIAEAASSVLLHPDSSNAFSLRSPQVIDAPVSGGVPGAVGATLTFMAGGEASAVAQAEPILLHMGKKVVYCGKSGSGQAAKLANNLALAIQMASIAEGLSFGAQQGLDPAVLSSIFNSSSAHCWSSEKYNPVPGLQDGVPSARGYQGGFSTALMLKDLRLALKAAETSDAKLPMTKKACELYEQLAEKMGPNLDFSAIYKYIYQSK